MTHLRSPIVKLHVKKTASWFRRAYSGIVLAFLHLSMLIGFVDVQRENPLLLLWVLEVEDQGG